MRIFSQVDILMNRRKSILFQAKDIAVHKLQK
jgi:hypothetical protein